MEAALWLVTFCMSLPGYPDRLLCGRPQLPLVLIRLR